MRRRESRWLSARWALGVFVFWLVVGGGVESHAVAGCGGYVVLFRSSKLLPDSVAAGMRGRELGISPLGREAGTAARTESGMHRTGGNSDGEGECRGHSGERELPLPVSLVSLTTEGNALPVTLVVADRVVDARYLRRSLMVVYQHGLLDEIFEPPR